MAHLALDVMDVKTNPLGLMISWEKTKVLSLSDSQPPPDAISMDDNQLEVIEKYCYIGR